MIPSSAVLFDSSGHDVELAARLRMARTKTRVEMEVVDLQGMSVSGQTVVSALNPFPHRRLPSDLQDLLFIPAGPSASKRRTVCGSSEFFTLDAAIVL